MTTTPNSAGSAENTAPISADLRRIDQSAARSADRDTHFYLAGWNGARGNADSHEHFRRALQSAPPALAAVAVPESHTQALQSIAEYPVTDMLANMDAANMHSIARAALAAAPAQAVAVPAVTPLVGDETEEENLYPWQAGTSKPAIDGRYLRDFDEGMAISVFIGGEWTRDGFFASDVQDAPWRGLSKFVAPAQEHAAQRAGQGQEPTPEWLPYSARTKLAERWGVKVTPAFNAQVRDVIETYIATHSAAPIQAQEDALDAAELEEVQRAISDFEECGETHVSYDLLMRAANLGYLDCTRFDTTDDGQAKLDAARAAQGGA